MAVWNSEEVLKFIDLYQNEPIIWNPKHEQHKNKNKASQSTYNEEQTSTDTDLNSPVPETSSHSEIAPGTSSSSEINKIKVPVLKRRAKDPPELAEAGREMSNAFSTLNKVLNKNTASQDDECELYGRLLAKKLKKFPENEREEIMLEIDNMIMNRRRKKQNTHNNSYPYTISSRSSQSSDQSEWSYTSSLPHSRPPSTDINDETYNDSLQSQSRQFSNILYEAYEKA